MVFLLMVHVRTIEREQGGICNGNFAWIWDPHLLACPEWR